MSDGTKPLYRYSLSGIELIESHVQPPASAEEAASGVNFNVNLENSVHEEHGWILCKVTVLVATQHSMLQVGKLAVMVAFKLADYATLIKTEGGKAIIPEDLLATLNGIAISTTRGIMFGVFKGTPLHAALLPLLDVKAFAPELPLEAK